MAIDRDTVRLLSTSALAFFNSTKHANVYTSDTTDEEGTHYNIVKLQTKDGSSRYFLLLTKLGAGAFGEVYKGEQLDIDAGVIIANTEAAIKITDITQGGTVGKRDLAKAMAESEHENNVLSMIDQSYGFSTGERQKQVEIELDETHKETRMVSVQEAIVAMPLFSGADIQNKAHKDKFSYGSLTFAQLASRLSQNLFELHAKTIVHADLKPANVIWDTKNGLAQIVDFNRAKIIAEPAEFVLDTSSSDQAYMAPECFPSTGGYRYSKASDIFSLGLILSEKFNIENDTPNLKSTLQNRPYLSYDQLLVKQFIGRMLSGESTRPTADQCSCFFSGLERKLRYDIEQPDNSLRLKLSKKLIGLEVYANQLAKEINTESRLHHFLAKNHLVADKTQKYEQALKSIALLVSVLSNEIIDTNPLKDQEIAFTRSDSNANGFFSFRGRYQKLHTELMREIEETADIEQLTIRK